MKIVIHTDKFKEEAKDPKILENFLNEFNNFVLSYLDKNPDFYKTIIGKKIRFIVKNEKKDFTCNLDIGKKIFVESNAPVSKEFEISGNLFKALIDKEILFDDLYQVL